MTTAPAWPTTSQLAQTLPQALAGLAFRKRRVAFLLGSDALIPHETRVALTPQHVAQLRQDLAACGLEPEILVHAGAGERARSGDQLGFQDHEFAAAGARIVTREKLCELPPLDVVHALKEPTDYESELPGPFLRIGALHLASKPAGLCRLLARRNFAAIFDGGTIGNCAYLKFGGDRTPIVNAMSRFAGAVAARKLIAGMAGQGQSQGKVIVVGGGIAGQSAIRQLDPRKTELIVVEIAPQLAARLPGILCELGFTQFRVVSTVTDEALTDAIGILFAHRSGAKAAEKVCRFEQICKMRRGAAIADIAIDQGGSIDHDGYAEADDALTSRRKYQALLKDFFYYAETNMPREEPYGASEFHGNASLPYVTLLLALCALYGGPQPAADHLLAGPARVYRSVDELAEFDLLRALTQDLRNGLQLARVAGRVEIVEPDILSDPNLCSWIRHCANSG